MPLLSIVTPVYNCEQYVGGCIDSVLRQSDPEEVEIVLTDDGSTDGSLRILQQYAEKYRNVRVFAVRHGGPSAARNEGLRQALGNYIYFLDSDDELVDGALNVIKRVLAETPADITIFDHQRIFSETHISVCRVKDGRAFTLTGQETISQLLLDFLENPNSLLPVQVLWSKLFRSELIKGGQIFFDESRHNSEDDLFSYECFAKARSVRYEPHVTCVSYRNRNNIASRTSYFTDIENMKTPYFLLRDQLLAIGRPEAEDLCAKALTTRFISGCYHLSRICGWSNFGRAVRQMRLRLNDPDLRKGLPAYSAKDNGNWEIISRLIKARKPLLLILAFKLQILWTKLTRPREK